MAVRNSSSSLDWNSSSRGRVSRMWRSALPLWLVGIEPGLVASRSRGARAPAGCPTADGCTRWRCTGRGSAVRRPAGPWRRSRARRCSPCSRAMHGGARIGLGQDQRVHRARSAACSAPPARSAVAACPRPCRAAGPGRCPRPATSTSCLAALDHLVFAVAEEGEVVVGGPAQELLRLALAVVGDRHAALADVVGDSQHLGAHRAPVEHDRAHVIEHLLRCRP